MDKKERILFTCVGKTDPVRDCRDGAMLHIIRHYLPQKVYIVLSKEMEAWNKRDNRYNKAIKKFCCDFHEEIDVHFLPCGIEDVSNFDAFDSLFQKYLAEIVCKNPDAEILLNVSSGSPQMKVTMCLLADNIKFRKIKAIQVITPQRGANVSENTIQKEYDLNAEIELNDDNEPSSENRCREPEILSIKRAIALKQVQALLDSYEYKSLKILLKFLGLTDKTSPAMKLTEHLLLRQDLKTKEAENLASGKEFGIDLFPIANVKCREATEFFLVLQNLGKTGKTTEFVLRLNPFVIKMQELYLLKEFHFDCERIKEETSSGSEKIVKRDKIEAINHPLMVAIDGCFKGGFRDSHPNIILYNRILKFLNNRDKKSTYYIDFFDTCESINRERNSSAHSLYGIDESDLKRTPNEILDTLRKLLLICYGKECRKEIFSIYDRTNKLIINSL